MLTSYLKKELARKLAVYFKDITPDKLSLSLFKGKAVFDGLELQERFLREALLLPSWMVIRKASCRKVTCSMSLTRYKTQPMHIHITDVQMVIEAVDPEDPSHQSRRQLLEEELHRQEQESQQKQQQQQQQHSSTKTQAGEDAADDEKGDKYGTADEIADGLSVDVNAIIISLHTPDFALVADFEDLRMQSVNSRWEFIKDLRHGHTKEKDHVTIYKLLSISSIRLFLSSPSKKLDEEARRSTVKFTLENPQVRIALRRSRRDNSQTLGFQVSFILDILRLEVTKQDIQIIQLTAHTMTQLVKAFSKISPPSGEKGSTERDGDGAHTTTSSRSRSSSLTKKKATNTPTHSTAAHHQKFVHSPADFLPTFLYVRVNTMILGIKQNQESQQRMAKPKRHQTRPPAYVAKLVAERFIFKHIIREPWAGVQHTPPSSNSFYSAFTAKRDIWLTRLGYMACSPFADAKMLDSDVTTFALTSLHVTSETDANIRFRSASAPPDATEETEEKQAKKRPLWTSTSSLSESMEALLPPSTLPTSPSKASSLDKGDSGNDRHRPHHNECEHETVVLLQPNNDSMEDAPEPQVRNRPKGEEPPTHSNGPLLFIEITTFSRASGVAAANVIVPPSCLFGRVSPVKLLLHHSAMLRLINFSNDTLIHGLNGLFSAEAALLMDQVDEARSSSDIETVLQAVNSSSELKALEVLQLRGACNRRLVALKKGNLDALKREELKPVDNTAFNINVVVESPSIQLPPLRHEPPHIAQRRLWATVNQIVITNSKTSQELSGDTAKLARFYHSGLFSKKREFQRAHPSFHFGNTRDESSANEDGSEKLSFLPKRSRLHEAPDTPSGLFVPSKFLNVFIHDFQASFHTQKKSHGFIAPLSATVWLFDLTSAEAAEKLSLSQRNSAFLSRQASADGSSMFPPASPSSEQQREQPADQSDAEEFQDTLTYTLVALEDAVHVTISNQELLYINRLMEEFTRNTWLLDGGRDAAAPSSLCLLVPSVSLTASLMPRPPHFPIASPVKDVERTEVILDARLDNVEVCKLSFRRSSTAYGVLEVSKLHASHSSCVPRHLIYTDRHPKEQVSRAASRPNGEGQSKDGHADESFPAKVTFCQRTTLPDTHLTQPLLKAWDARCFKARQLQLIQQLHPDFFAEHAATLPGNGAVGDGTTPFGVDGKSSGEGCTVPVGNEPPDLPRSVSDVQLQSNDAHKGRNTAQQQEDIVRQRLSHVSSATSEGFLRSVEVTDATSDQGSNAPTEASTANCQPQQIVGESGDGVEAASSIESLSLHDVRPSNSSSTTTAVDAMAVVDAASLTKSSRLIDPDLPPREATLVGQPEVAELSEEEARRLEEKRVRHEEHEKLRRQISDLQQLPFPSLMTSNLCPPRMYAHLEGLDVFLTARSIELLQLFVRDYKEPLLPPEIHVKLSKLRLGLGDELDFSTAFPAYPAPLLEKIAEEAGSRIELDGLCVRLVKNRNTGASEISIRDDNISRNAADQDHQGTGPMQHTSLSSSVSDEMNELRSEAHELQKSLDEALTEKDQLLKALHELSVELVRAKQQRAESDARLAHYVNQQRLRQQTK